MKEGAEWLGEGIWESGGLIAAVVQRKEERVDDHIYPLLTCSHSSVPLEIIHPLRPRSLPKRPLILRRPSTTLYVSSDLHGGYNFSRRPQPQLSPGPPSSPPTPFRH